MTKKTTVSLGRRRNLLHDAPLLRKGAAHGKTHKAKRRKEKVAVKKDWFFPCGLRSVAMGKTSSCAPMG
jgi:hypothetical protein